MFPVSSPTCNLLVGHCTKEGQRLDLSAIEEVVARSVKSVHNFITSATPKQISQNQRICCDRPSSYNLIRHMQQTETGRIGVVAWCDQQSAAHPEPVS